jgi:hypothetical protein
MATVGSIRMMCQYHERYSYGRHRKAVIAGAPHPTCGRTATWLLSLFERVYSQDAAFTLEHHSDVALCFVHRRAVDARYHDLKNDPGRWRSLRIVTATR